MHQPSFPGAFGATTQVDVSGHDDLHLWAERVAASEAHLRAVVLLVDSLPNDVRTELRRKQKPVDSTSPLRVFVFHPCANHHDWCVLLPVAGQRTFASEGEAVEFALAQARDLQDSGSAVEVVQEKITGTWIRLISSADVVR